MGAFELSTLEPGARVAGRYVVIGLLGRGGMGDVYEVEHIMLQRRFALKRLAADRADDRTVVERFLREARSAAASGHPGIVEVFDLGYADEGWPFLVMEKLVGFTLRDRLHAGPLPLADALRLGGEILDALDAVHRLGIIHRDIKPENIFLVRRDGSPARVKVLDFGIARLQDEATDVRLTQTGAVVGTPLYMAPEQARSETVDQRTDLYALGVVLYESLAGSPPFSGTYSSLVAAILEKEPSPDKLAHVPDRITAVIMRAMRKEPDERFAHAREMRHALLGDGVPHDLGHSVTVLSDDLTIAAPGEAVGQEGPTPPPAGRSSPDTASSAAVASGLAAGATGPPSSAEGERVSAGSSTISGTTGERAGTLGAARTSLGRWIVAGVVVVVVAAVVVWRLGPDDPAPRRDAVPPVAGKSHRDAGGVGIAMGARADAGVKTVQRSPVPAAVWRLMRQGKLDDAAEALRRAALRAPRNYELRAYNAAVALEVKRKRAYKEARKIRGQNLSPAAKALVEAVIAQQEGKNSRAIPALDRAIERASPPESVLLRFVRAHLLRYVDRFDEARAEYERVLARWPAFSPAVDALLYRLLMRGEASAAQKLVRDYTAAASDGRDLEMLELELLIGLRRYRAVLDRISKLIKADPGREAEFYQFTGDLRLLLFDVPGAIAAYDTVGAGQKRDHYVFGALLTGGRVSEARALILRALTKAPADVKLSRHGKLGLDAVLLAWDRRDADLARRVRAALLRFDHRPHTVRYHNAMLLASVVAGELATPGSQSAQTARLPLPYRALVQARAVKADAALAILRPATNASALRFHTVSTHVYPLLQTEMARASAEAKDDEAVLRWSDRVIRPVHLDASRGIVVGRAIDLRIAALRRLNRGGEADALARHRMRLKLRR